MDANETALVCNTEILFMIDRNGVELMNISSPDNNILFWGMPVKDGEGNIYVGSVNRTDQGTEYPWYTNSSFYSFYPNGSIRWEIRDYGYVGFNPTIYRNRIFFMSTAASVYCAYLNGTIEWTYRFNRTTGWTHSLAFDSEGNVYFTGMYDQYEGAVYSFALNGTYRWHYDILAPGPAPVISKDDIIYINEGTTLYSFFSNGTLNWKKVITPGNVDDLVVRDDGSLLINCGYTIHYLFKNGTTNWTQPFSSPIFSDLVVSKDGYMVIITRDVKLRVLDPKLEEIFTFDPDDYSHIAPIIGPGGDIYFSGDDGIYYKIGKAVPSPPMNLTGRFGDEFVQLYWDPPRFDGGIGIDEYRIYRGGQGIGGYPLHATVNGDITTFNDTEVVNGREYIYTVVAVNIINISLPSNYVAGIPTGLADPPVVKRVWSYQGAVNFEWEPPFDWGGTEILSYHLYRSGDNVTFDQGTEIYRTYTQYADDDVVPENEYYYYFRTKNKNGEGPPGPVIKIVHHGPPSVPTKFKGIGGDGFIDLVWVPPTYDAGIGITKYFISKYTNYTDIIFIDVDGESESYHDEDVTNGIDHYFSISATNDYGRSNKTREIKVTPFALPGPPENLTVQRVGSNAILKWDHPQETEDVHVLSLRVYLRIGSSTFEPVGQIDPTLDSYEYQGVMSGTTYYFYMTSVSAFGESVPSNTVNLEALQLDVKVELISVELENGTIMVEWEPLDIDNLSLPADPDPSFVFLGYDLHREDPTGTDQALSTPDQTIYRDVNFTYGIRYTYFVTLSYMAFGERTYGPPSEPMSILPTTLPDPPVLIDAVSRDGGVEVWWAPPDFDGGTPITGYRIVRTTPSQRTGVTEVSYQMNYLLENQLQNGETYSYFLYSINAVGLSEKALIFDITPLGLPSAPRNLSYSFLNDEIRLFWDPPEDDGGAVILGYIVLMGDSLDLMELRAVVEGNISELIEEMGDGEVRYYQVAAFNEVGTGESTGLLKIDTNSPEVVDDDEDGASSWTWLVILLVILMVLVVVLLLYLTRRRAPEKIEE